MPGMEKILFNLKFTARSMEKEAAKMERAQKQNNDKALACVNDDVRAIPALAPACITDEQMNPQTPPPPSTFCSKK
jgi:hypothetical protein